MRVKLGFRLVVLVSLVYHEGPCTYHRVLQSEELFS